MIKKLSIALFVVSVLSLDIIGCGNQVVTENQSQNFWQQFLEGLSSSGLSPINPKTFRLASGLSIADWEGVNYTGLDLVPKSQQGEPIPSNIYIWADTMPKWGYLTYQRGESFYDQYSAFVNAIQQSGEPDLNTIQSAQKDLIQYKMTDKNGKSWPGYTISPSLNDFFLASLFTVTSDKPPKIDFTIALKTSACINSTDCDIPFFGVSFHNNTLPVNRTSS
ncbi:hypothetical protein HYR99_37235 [Candidatus Poribacteria bacterium]|nr:hypothetical protein [Candidatus Poribacteria bacterium]